MSAMPGKLIPAVFGGSFSLWTCNQEAHMISLRVQNFCNSVLLLLLCQRCRFFLTTNFNAPRPSCMSWLKRFKRWFCNGPASFYHQLLASSFLPFQLKNVYVCNFMQARLCLSLFSFRFSRMPLPNLGISLPLSLLEV